MSLKAKFLFVHICLLFRIKTLKEKSLRFGMLSKGLGSTSVPSGKEILW